MLLIQHCNVIIILTFNSRTLCERSEQFFRILQFQNRDFINFFMFLNNFRGPSKKFAGRRLLSTPLTCNYNAIYFEFERVINYVVMMYYRNFYTHHSFSCKHFLFAILFNYLTLGPAAQNDLERDGPSVFSPIHR